MKKMIAIMLAAGAMSGFAAPTANEDFVIAEDAKTYTNAVQAAKTYTDAAIAAMPSGGISTNDVCNIVTNEVSEWLGWNMGGENAQIFDPDIPSPFTWELVYNGEDEDDETGDRYWRWTIRIYDSFGELDRFYSVNVFTHPDETTRLVFASGDYVLTRKRSNRNALNLAREKDLPNKTPVDEILMNGADGKIYHLRIGTGGAIEVYLEVTP